MAEAIGYLCFVQSDHEINSVLVNIMFSSIFYVTQVSFNVLSYQRTLSEYFRGNNNN